MKQLVLAFLVSFSVFVGSVTNTSLVKTAFAEEPIKLNFGDVAKDNDVIGTADYNPEDGEAGFGVLLGKILTITLIIAANILLIMFVWGGFEWIAAGGDKAKIEKARNRITQSIVGIFVLTSVIAIFATIQSFLGFEVLEFSSGTAPTLP